MLIFEPSYFKKFSCVADKCRATCCKDWKIGLTKADYDNLRSKHLPTKIKTELRNCTRRITDDTNFYAEFVLDEENENLCPMLKNGLCSLQVDAGYEYLSMVCKTYPRQRYSFSKKELYRGCESSCEATLNLLLENRVSFEQRQATKYEEQIALREYRFIDYGEFQQLFEVVRTLSIAIMQNSAYTLENRLLLLGMATKALQPLWAEKNFEGFSNWLTTWAPLATGNNLDKELSELKGQYLLGIESCTNNLYMLSHSTKRGRELFNRACQGLGISVVKSEKKDENDEKLACVKAEINNETLKKTTKRFKEILEPYPYFMENLMVNHILNELFPMRFKENFFDSFISICYSYALMRFTAMGYVGENGTIEDAIDGIVQISRFIRHSENVINKNLETLKEQGKDTLGHMAYIIRI